jgi:hypothetical protein
MAMHEILRDSKARDKNRGMMSGFLLFFLTSLIHINTKEEKFQVEY